MKKLFLILVAMFAMFNIASAKDDVVVTSGSLVGLKTNEAKVYIVWDYSGATIEGKKVETFLAEKGQEWVDGYPSELSRAEGHFVATINKKSKTMKVVDDRSSADYVMTVKVGDLHYGSTGLSVVIGMGAGDAHLHANITVAKQDSKVAEVMVDGVPGSGFGNEVRRSNCYIEMAKWIVKLVKKAK